MIQNNTESNYCQGCESCEVYDYCDENIQHKKNQNNNFPLLWTILFDLEEIRDTWDEMSYYRYIERY